MNHLALQVVVLVVAAILIATGLMGLISGVDTAFYAVSMNHVDGNAILDSNMRFYAGLSIGLGLILALIAPTIERRGEVLALLAVPIFIGGLGRVASMASFQTPPPAFVAFAIAELAFPALVLWQRQVSAEIRTQPAQ